MQKYRLAGVEWEIDYKFNIDKHILGELIFELKEIFPDFSSPSGNFYFFRNLTTGKALFVDNKVITIRFIDSFHEEDANEILTILGKFIPNEKFNVRLKVKYFITNGESKVDFNSSIKKAIEDVTNGSKIRLIGFEIEEESATYFYSFQTRKDNLECQLIVNVNFGQILETNELYTETSDKLEKIGKFIEDNSLLTY